MNGVCSGSDWDRVEALHARYPDRIIPNFGVHPWWLKDRSPDWLDQLRERIESCAAAGVGECGVDRSDRCPVPLEEQLSVMTEHLHLARKYARPTSLHMVRCAGPMLDALKKLGGPVTHESPVVLHSFQGPPEMIPAFMALGPGVYFSLSGTLARIKRDKAVRVAREVPLDRLLVETDSPDGLLRLTSLGGQGQGEAEHAIAEGLVRVNERDGSPEPAGCSCGDIGRGDKEMSPAAAAGLNHPRNLMSVVQFLAALTGGTRTAEEIALHATRNAVKVFGLKNVVL